MAVKKATPKSSSTTKAAAPKKAAPKAAPKSAGATKAAPTKAAVKKAPKAKAAAVKKAPAIKLSDSQTRVLGSVQSAGESGYAAGKGEGKVLESLLAKKLIKRGKKGADGSARYLVTKAGTKHASGSTSTGAGSAPEAAMASPSATA